MKRLIVIAGLAALGSLLPLGAMSQSSMEFRYPDGLVVSPVPVVPSIGPTGDIGVSGGRDVLVTGSTAPREFTTPTGSETLGRPSCTSQTYTFGPGERVRVRRC
jgi:hypothetical protein